ncbi:MAG: ATP-binding protein [Dehalococcoidia bacterium]
MLPFERTRLWKSTLAEQPGEDEFREQRERLRNAFLRFRERAAVLAAEIARDLPEFTVHDVSHLDALWETGDLIAGEAFEINPVEAFILGGAFLVHDLGLGLAAYPGGLAELKQDVSWQDTVIALKTAELGRVPSAEELADVSPEMEREAKEQVLRNLHARRAEQLPRISWRDREGDAEYHLIEDVDLRNTYAPLIGRLGHSHWWPVANLNAQFGQKLGAPPGSPRDWTVDPLPLACLVRTADAAHIYGERAPGFLRAVRKPGDGSQLHWVFQEKVQQPHLETDRLVYASAHGFPAEDAEAWWLGFDLLRLADDELREVDSLLTDSGRQRFVAKGVRGAEDAMRLALFIRCDGWVPVDARIQVTDVAGLVQKLGGETLYGERSSGLIPVRELIQNACDAVRARRVCEARPEDWGDVTIRFGEDRAGPWMEVEDNGIGMSERVLTGPLLDFGTTYWGSLLMQHELPGLLAKGFESTGKYGIGFFSVFMLGDHVCVTTRRFDQGQQATRALEFEQGLASRPLLRRVDHRPSVRDGGTCVRVWLRKDPRENAQSIVSGGIFSPGFTVALAQMCAAIDVNLYLAEPNTAPVCVVRANDWLVVEPARLLARLNCLDYDDLTAYEKAGLREIGRYLRPLSGADGRPVGRAALPGLRRMTHGRWAADGVVYAGGLAVRPTNLPGMILGKTSRAARDLGVALVEPGSLARWATEQRELVEARAAERSDQRATLAAEVGAFGGDVGNLPIAYAGRRYRSTRALAAWFHKKHRMVLLERRAFDYADGKISLSDDVVLMQRQPYAPGQVFSTLQQRDWRSLVEDALAEAWSLSPAEVIGCRSDPLAYFMTHRRLPRFAVGKAGNKPVRLVATLYRRPRK